MHLFYSFRFAQKIMEQCRVNYVLLIFSELDAETIFRNVFGPQCCDRETTSVLLLPITSYFQFYAILEILLINFCVISYLYQ